MGWCPLGVVERWLLGPGSAGVESSSSGVVAGAGTDVVSDGVFDCEVCSVGEVERVSVEVAGLVGLSGGGDGLGPAGEFAGDGGVGRNMVVASLNHEPPVVSGELGVSSPGDVGGLVEREAELGWSLFGDAPR